MQISGHLAISYLFVQPGSLERPTLYAQRWRVLACALGALTPDIIDKSLRFVDVYPWGRTVGHSLVVWTFVALLWVLIVEGLGRGRSARWYLLGGFSHLAADLVDDVVAGIEHTGYVFSFWFTWPYLNPDVGYVVWEERAHACWSCPSSLEIGVVGLTLLWALSLGRGKMFPDEIVR